MADPARSLSARVTVMSFLIIMVDGYDTLMISFVAPLLARDWGLAPTDIGKLFATGYMGAIVGALSMGPLADRVGRRPMLLAALLLASVATLLSAAAQSLGMLMALRLVTGVALGGALPALMALTAEHARPGRRGGTVTLMYIGFPLGAVIGGAATAALIHHGWQSVFVGAGIASLLAAGLAALMPESSRRAERASDAGRRAALLTEQFAEGRLRPALLLWLGLFSMLVLTYFLVSWTPTIIIARGGSDRVAALGPVLLNLGGIGGALAMAPVIDRLGPYYPIAALLALGTVLVAMLGSAPGGVGAMLVLLTAIGACIMGGQLNFPAMTVDLFPPHVRGAGAGWTIAAGRVGSILGPLIGGVLLAAGLAFEQLFLTAAVPALVAAAALFAAGRMRRRGLAEPAEDPTR